MHLELLCGVVAANVVGVSSILVSGVLEYQDKKRFKIAKKPILDYIKKNNSSIREEDIDYLAKSKFIGSEKGDLEHISETISQEIIEIKKKIKEHQKDLGIDSENRDFSQKEETQKQTNFRENIRCAAETKKESRKEKSQYNHTRKVNEEKSGEGMER